MDIRTYVKGLQDFGNSCASRRRNKKVSTKKYNSPFRLEQLEARTLLSGDLGAALQVPVVPQPAQASNQPAAIVQTESNAPSLTSAQGNAHNSASLYGVLDGSNVPGQGDVPIPVEMMLNSPDMATALRLAQQAWTLGTQTVSVSPVAPTPATQAAPNSTASSDLVTTQAISNQSDQAGSRQSPSSLPTVDPVVSQALTTQPFSASAYYVSTGGSDSNAGTADQPFRTIAQGLRSLHAGETLYIRGGTYNETIDSSNLPSGTSWANAPVIAGHPGESVILTASGSGTDIISLSGSTQYVMFKNLILDGQGTAHNGVNNPNNSTHHIRFENVEIRNFWNQGAFVMTSLGGYEFINCNVHHIVAGGHQSANHSHGLYLGNSVLVDGGQYHDNSGYGIQIYNSNYPMQPTNNNIIRNAEIYNNATGGVTIGGDSNVVNNNRVYSNGSGIDVMWGSPSNTQLYNNIVS